MAHKSHKKPQNTRKGKSSNREKRLKKHRKRARGGF